MIIFIGVVISLS